MSEKFTPGPWVIERHDNHSYTLDVVGGEESAIGEIYVDWDGEAEGTANAHLISAAPEMYEALRAIIADLPQNRDWLDPVLERVARDALKKARGEK